MKIETSAHLQETKLKIVVLLSRVERDSSQNIGRDWQFPTPPIINYSSSQPEDADVRRTIGRSYMINCGAAACIIALASYLVVVLRS
jgi:hypothetical protein